MKNKKFLVIVATALMVCLVAGMGAMTYSKYITSSKTANQATAAQWGFVVSANADNLFGTDYDDTDSDKKATIVTRAGETSEISVRAQTTASNIVAPGTTGSMTFFVSGTAEVLAQITMTITGIDGNPISEIHYDNYYPVVWTLTKNVSGAITTIKSGTLKQVADTFNTVDPETIKPGAEATAAGTYTLSWEWPLETGDGDVKAQNNVYDTLIGFKAMSAIDDVNYTWAKIANTYVGDKLISGVATEANYDAIVTQMAFVLNINIEQVQ